MAEQHHSYFSVDITYINVELCRGTHIVEEACFNLFTGLDIVEVIGHRLIFQHLRAIRLQDGTYDR